MSVAVNPGGSESRDDMFAELTHALEAIAHATPGPERSGEDVAKQKRSGTVALPTFAVLLERLTAIGPARLWTLAGLLATVCVGAVVVSRPSSEAGAARPAPALNLEAAKTSLGDQTLSPRTQPQPERTVVGPLPPELTQSVQAIARELASLGQGIEQLKASQAQFARDNAELAGRLKETQDQMARRDAELTALLKAAEQKAARDSLSVAEQLKASQDQMASIGEQLKAGTASKPLPRPPKVTSPTPTPTPSVLSLITTAKPAPKPKPSQTGQAPKNSTQSQPKRP